MVEEWQFSVNVIYPSTVVLQYILLELVPCFTGNPNLVLYSSWTPAAQHNIVLVLQYQVPGTGELEYLY